MVLTVAPNVDWENDEAAATEHIAVLKDLVRRVFSIGTDMCDWPCVDEDACEACLYLNLDAKPIGGSADSRSVLPIQLMDEVDEGRIAQASRSGGIGVVAEHLY